MILSSQQLVQLSQIIERDFELRVMRHLKLHFSRKIQDEELGDDLLLQLIHECLGRARLHGFESERAMTLYIDMAVLFGLGFEERDEFVEIATVLSDRSTSAEERVVQICDYLRAQAVSC